MIYLIYLMILFILAIYEQRNIRFPKFCYWILLVFLVLLIGLRDGIGADTLRYIDYYKDVPLINELDKYDFTSTRFQPGFIIVQSICKSINENFWFFQMVQALVINVIIFLFIQTNTKYIFTAILFYFTLNYLEFNTEILRESFSVALGLLAYHMLKENKKILYVFLFIISSFLHISSFIILFYPLLLRIKPTRKSISILILVVVSIPLIMPYIQSIESFLILFSGGQEDLIQSYMDFSSQQSHNVNYYLVFFANFVIIPFFFVFITKEKTEKYFGFICAFIVLQLMSSYSYAFYRMANYVSPFYWLLIAESVRVLSVKFRLRSFVLSIFLVFFLYSFQRKLFNEDKQEGNKYMYERYIPYKSVVKF